VVKMRGWERQMIWQDTGLRWVQTSPNIPRPDSPAYYIATGIVGSLAGLETGVGGEAPFEICAGKGIDPDSFTRFVQNLNLDGVQARPYTAGGFGGCRLSVNPRGKGDLSFLALALLAEVNRLSKPDLFAKSSPDKLDIFFKVYGTSNIRDQLRKGIPFQRLAQEWRSGVERFRSERSSYLFY